MGVRIVVRAGETIRQALLRLKKELARSGQTWEVRRRRYRTDRTLERRKKRFQKRFKSREATLEGQQTGKQPVDSLREAKARFWKRTGKP
jgi:ribosomal protein S21